MRLWRGGDVQPGCLLDGLRQNGILTQLLHLTRRKSPHVCWVEVELRQERRVGQNGCHRRHRGERHNLIVIVDKPCLFAWVQRWDKELLQVVQTKVHGDHPTEGVAFVHRRGDGYHQPLPVFVQIGFGDEGAAVGVVFRPSPSKEFMCGNRRGEKVLVRRNPGIQAYKRAA